MQMLNWRTMSLNHKHRKIYKQLVNWQRRQVQSSARKKATHMNVQTHRNSHFFHTIVRGTRIAWALAKNIAAVANSIARDVSKVYQSHWKSNAMNVSKLNFIHLFHAYLLKLLSIIQLISFVFNFLLICSYSWSDSTQMSQGTVGRNLLGIENV